MFAVYNWLTYLSRAFDSHVIRVRDICNGIARQSTIVTSSHFMPIINIFFLFSLSLSLSFPSYLCLVGVTNTHTVDFLAQNQEEDECWVDE